MLKKLLVLIAILSMAAFAVACGGDDTTDTTTATTAAPVSTETTAAAETTTTAAATESTEAVAPVTLRLQGAFPEGGAHYYYLETFQQKVQEYSGGTLTVEWGAGPEAIPANELAEALANDAVESGVLTLHVHGELHARDAGREAAGSGCLPYQRWL